MSFGITFLWNFVTLDFTHDSWTSTYLSYTMIYSDTYLSSTSPYDETRRVTIMDDRNMIVPNDMDLLWW